MTIPGATYLQRDVLVSIWVHTDMNDSEHSEAMNTPIRQHEEMGYTLHAVHPVLYPRVDEEDDTDALQLVMHFRRVSPVLGDYVEGIPE